MATLTISDLTPAQRLALIGELWDSLDVADLPLSAAQEAEIDRRLETADADATAGKTWGQILSILRPART